MLPPSDGQILCARHLHLAKIFVKLPVPNKSTTKLHQISDVEIRNTQHHRHICTVTGI